MAVRLNVGTDVRKYQGMGQGMGQGMDLAIVAIKTLLGLNLYKILAIFDSNNLLPVVAVSIM